MTLTSQNRDIETLEALCSLCEFGKNQLARCFSSSSICLRHGPRYYLTLSKISSMRRGQGSPFASMTVRLRGSKVGLRSALFVLFCELGVLRSESARSEYLSVFLEDNQE